MTVSLFGVPLQSWAVLVLTGSAGAGVYTLWDTYQSRRGAVPLFDSSVVRKTEVFKRYPAEALKGFDVVVKNYYVPADQAPPTASASCLRDRSHGSTPPARSVAATAGGTKGTRDWTRFWKDSFYVFSNEYTLGQRVSRSTGSASSSGHASDETSTRIVVGDAYAPSATATAASSKTSSPSSAMPVLASSRWPPGMVKYSAMVLEPHQETSSQAALDPERGFLRQLADSATHQSLVRCNPMSTNTRINCDGDAGFLGAPYLRLMLSAFLLLPSHVPSLHVTVLGVGGGSLPNFLQQYFSRVISKLDLVDVEPACFRAAVEDMGLKETLNNRRTHDAIVRMHAVDAVEYLLRQIPSRAIADVRVSSSTYVAPDSLPSVKQDAAAAAAAVEKNRLIDLLFVDVFVGSEQPDGVTSRDFVDLCHMSLSSYGVAAFNLPERNPPFVASCRAVFGSGNVFTLPVPASSNTVVLARKAGGPLFSTGAPPMSHRHFWRRAQQLTDTYQLPYDLANHYPAWWRFW